MYILIMPFSNGEEHFFLPFHGPALELSYPRSVSLNFHTFISRFVFACFIYMGPFLLTHPAVVLYAGILFPGDGFKILP